MFLPGFIYIQIIEYHLLREKKNQFEKTLEIVLNSIFIWVISSFLPIWWPWNEQRLVLLEHLPQLLVVSNSADENLTSNDYRLLIENAGYFFFAVIFWVLIFANIYGVIRKFRYVDGIFKVTTGRDWYPSVSFNFYQNYINKPVEVKTENLRIIGILFSAPDTREDDYILLKDIYFITEAGIEKSKINDSILLETNKIEYIISYKDSILKGKKNGRSKNSIG